MADRYTFDQDFDGVYLYDIYTDTVTGKKYGVMYEDTLELLNSQAAEIADLRSRIANLVDACGERVGGE